MKLIVENSGLRIDKYLMEQIDLSRSKVSSMIEKGDVLVNGNIPKSSYKVKVGDEITYVEFEEEQIAATAENIKIDIVYEDDSVLVVNKENGMVVHPAPTKKSGTLVNALLYHSKSLSDVNGEFRPGIVHRIDAYTTGLLMVAKNNKAHEILANELALKKTKRKYIALVWGVIKEDTATIDAPIGRDTDDRKKYNVTNINSKNAVTHLKVLERYKTATLVELTLETGRTHQIRVHMNYINHPVVNDPVYGRRKKFDNSGQCLHAATLGFTHPTTNEFMEFQASMPECMLEIIEQLKTIE